MRGLIIKQPWIAYTLNGNKPFEIRTRPTRIRERIGLICAGTGEVWGEVDVAMCECYSKDSAIHISASAMGMGITGDLGETVKRDIARYVHMLPSDELFLWGFDNIIRYDKPRKYKHPQGAQTWIREIEFMETNYE